jgi:hypothetical protein
MANPTTNFGWQMPTSTDLVTDLPADFEVFGQAVDTALVDLKGGTTGQVLAKASNTNMDFVWVAQDDANAIQNTQLTAKGALISAVSAGTPATLTVGNNGETLVADSSTSTGLRYQGSMAAGGNFLINGLFDIWQRGTSSTTTNNYGSADRWVQYAISGTGTFSQDASVIPSGALYSMKFVASATAQPSIIQVIETMNTIPIAGQTVTLSAFVANSASANMDFILGYSTNADEAWTGTYTTITATAGSNTLTGITTSLTRRSLTFAIPSTAKTLRVWIRTTATIASAATVNWGGVMLQLGSVPTTLVRNGATIQGELAACQRYLPAITTASAADIGTGFNVSTTQPFCMVPFQVPARVAPTGITATATNFGARNTGGSVITLTAIAFNNASPMSCSVLGTVASGLVAGQGTTMQLTGTILFTGCEL